MKFVSRKSKSAFSKTYISDRPPTPEQLIWLEEVFSLGSPEHNPLVNESVGYLNGPDADGLVHLSFYGSSVHRDKLLSIINARFEDKPQE